jgi:hypothetical protein
MTKAYVSLQPSEGMIFQSASTIYAAYVSAGKVADEEVGKWMKRAIREAVAIAQAIDEAIISDDEA